MSATESTESIAGAQAGGHAPSFIGDLCRPVSARGWRGFGGQLRRHGPVGVFPECRRVIRNAIGAQLSLRYDRRHGVDTAGSIKSANYEHMDGNNGYLPISRMSFHHVMDAVGIRFEDYSFIDYGSGKGRAVLLAAERPFKRAVGVEFSTSLFRDARQNVLDFRNGDIHRDRIQMELADARNYPPPSGPCLVYMYAPFEDDVLAAVLAHIAEDYKNNPRPLVVVYCEDSHGYEIPKPLFDALDFLTPTRAPKAPLDLTAPREIQYVIYASDEALKLQQSANSRLGGVVAQRKTLDRRAATPA